MLPSGSICLLSVHSWCLNRPLLPHISTVWLRSGSHLRFKLLKRQIPIHDLGIDILHAVKVLERGVIWTECERVSQQIVSESEDCSLDCQTLLLYRAVLILMHQELAANVQNRALLPSPSPGTKSALYSTWQSAEWKGQKCQVNATVGPHTKLLLPGLKPIFLDLSIGPDLVPPF